MMPENKSIEENGMKILLKYLSDNGRKAEKSNDRTFDLIVDGNYAEMKAKKNSWDKFDFISLTSKQKKALGKTLKSIFIVLNVGQPSQAEVVEISADDLVSCRSREIIHYEWNKGDMQHLRRK